MRYLIIDKDYCVFKTNVISGQSRNALKAGLISIIDVKNMEGMDIDGWSFSKVQDWSDNMINAELVKHFAVPCMCSFWR